jgi:hypothetical protein
MRLKQILRLDDKDTKSGKLIPIGFDDLQIFGFGF